ncbi:MAG TPA: metal-sensitive transcriptional regulator [Terriglobales bacterium]|nr:metal-sensitive transcriptional regulator [Terriglobales bacterium]
MKPKSEHAHGSAEDPEIKKNLQVRLRRVEGQVRGLQKMVEDERYCPEILEQMSAVHASLRSIERVLLRGHLQHCATEALRSGDERKAQRTYEELTELFYKHSR